VDQKYIPLKAASKLTITKILTNLTAINGRAWYKARRGG
jgi:hypothetical protein